MFSWMISWWRARSHLRSLNEFLMVRYPDAIGSNPAERAINAIEAIEFELGAAQREIQRAHKKYSYGAPDPSYPTQRVRPAAPEAPPAPDVYVPSAGIVGVSDTAPPPIWNTQNRQDTTPPFRAGGAINAFAGGGATVDWSDPPTSVDLAKDAGIEMSFIDPPEYQRNAVATGGWVDAALAGDGLPIPSVGDPREEGNREDADLIIQDLRNSGEDSSQSSTPDSDMDSDTSSDSDLPQASTPSSDED